MSGENACSKANKPCKRWEYCHMPEVKCKPYCFHPNFIKKIDRVCEDADECSTNPHLCRSTHECMNTVGSYFCKRVSCRKGFRLENDRCKDINECTATPGICGDGGSCVNYYGGFYCRCKRGYKRDPNSKGCVDRDECEFKVCFHKCHNNVGSYSCSCPQGYKSRGAYCQDIDECATDPCGQDTKCFNTFGGYQCIPKASQEKLEAPVVSFKWRATAMRKTVDRKNFQFQYGLTGFSDNVEMHFYFESGDDDGVFYIEKIEKNKIMFYNDKAIVGPKTFTLRLHADVLNVDGQLISRYVYVYYIFVGEYSF